MEINIYSSCQKLYAQVQAIEEKLEQPDVEPETLHTLFHQLDEAHASMGVLQNQAHTVGLFARQHLADLNALEEHIVCLYGRIHTLSIDYEFHKIQEETLHLGKPLQSGDIQTLAKEVDALKKHMVFLKQTQRPSWQNKQVMALAHRFLEKVDAVLEGKISPASLAQLLQHLQNAFNEISEKEAMNPEVAEQVMELIEVADLFYHDKSKDAQRQYNRLPEDLKRRIKGHMNHLEAASFDDLYKTTQAVFATVNELSESNARYPSKEEIDLWFMGSDQGLRV